jgi:Carboxypeptidase regulatory-like domain
MRSFGVRLPILAATAWAGIGFTVSGMDLGYSETVYATPTVATLAWPTSYVASRSYIVPTAYSFPSYIPAAYEPVTLAPTYVTTAYQVRRGLFGRLRLVERPIVASYLPTTYVAPSYYATSYRLRSYTPTFYTPTVFEYPRVWQTSYTASAASECDPCDTPLMASTYRSYPATSQSDSSSAQTYSVPRSSGSSGRVRSEATDDPTIPSNVDPAQAEEPTLRSSVQSSPKTAAPEATADSPPKPPVPQKEKSTAAPNQPAPAAGGAEATKAGGAAPAGAKSPAPIAPSGNEPAEPDLKPAPLDNTATNRRETLRPIYPITRTLRPELRNVLVGRVESDSGDPLGEVSVSVTRMDDTSIRRAGMTNAFGTFAIRLTDGEWTVNVRMPSGRYYAVRSVTVSNGKIVDNQEGREVRNLIISY